MILESGSNFEPVFSRINGIRSTRYKIYNRFLMNTFATFSNVLFISLVASYVFLVQPSDFSRLP